MPLYTGSAALLSPDLPPAPHLWLADQDIDCDCEGCWWGSIMLVRRRPIAECHGCCASAGSQCTCLRWDSSSVGQADTSTHLLLPPQWVPNTALSHLLLILRLFFPISPHPPPPLSTWLMLIVSAASLPPASLIPAPHYYCPQALTQCQGNC